MEMFGWEGLKKLGRRKQATDQEAGTGAGTKCVGCQALLVKKTLEDNYGVCPECGHHHRISARRRIEITLDPDSFEERDSDLAAKDVLSFQAVKSYADSLDRARRRSGLLSAMVIGMGALKARRVAFGITDSDFMMGSMGSVVGEKFVRLVEYAMDERAPLIIFSGSGGGARMQEGMYSLMQMAKTSAALGRLHEAGLPFLCVCCDPTMAGVWASWAALGDVLIAEPHALISFTGARVIKATINCELAADFQTAEFLLKHGQIDMIVPRHDMRDRLASILGHLLGEADAMPEAG